MHRISGIDEGAFKDNHKVIADAYFAATRPDFSDVATCRIAGTQVRVYV